MGEWEAARDRQMQQYISHPAGSTYDLVARDVWFRNGEKADLLRYRQESYEFEVFGFYDPIEEDETVMELEGIVTSLRSIGRLLSKESFKYKVSTKRTDNVGGDEPWSGADYYFFDDADVEVITTEIEDVLGPQGVFKAE